MIVRIVAKKNGFIQLEICNLIEGKAVLNDLYLIKIFIQLCRNLRELEPALKADDCF